MYFINPNGNLQELEGFSAYRSLRRQDLPPVYIRDGGFYLIGDNS
jgi:CMP-N-acetylneuraminic acid synthetase